MSKMIEIKVKCSVDVNGETKSDSVNVPCLFVESIPDAKNALVARYQAAIDKVPAGEKRPSALTIEQTDSSGKVTKIDATAEQLTGRFMIDAFNEKLEREVYQPAYIALKTSLQGPETVYEQMAKNMVKNFAKLGRTISLTDALAKVRKEFEN